MVLRDAAGLVVDSLNYGLLVDPWAAEGYQAVSGAGQSGCRVTAPGTGGRGGPSTGSGQAVARCSIEARAVFRMAATPTATATISCCKRPQLCRPPRSRRDQYQGGQRDRLRRRSDNHD
jgi:hypothetical protein